MMTFHSIINLVLILMMAVFAYDGDISFTIYAGFLLMFSCAIGEKE